MTAGARSRHPAPFVRTAADEALPRAYAAAARATIDRLAALPGRPRALEPFDSLLCDDWRLEEIRRSGRVVVEAGLTLPGLAPVAIQQARYVAKAIQARLRGSMPPPFRYLDKGSLPYIVGFENRLLVFIQWAFSYFTFNRRARLITGHSPLPFKHSPQARDRIARSRHG